MKLLIVDDMRAMRRLLARAVEEAGFRAEVTEAGGAAQALGLMARTRFDLVLADYYMPGMDGSQLLARLREDPELAGVPVVIITTESDPAILRALVQQGARACLSKPFTSDALARAIRRALAS